MTRQRPGKRERSTTKARHRYTNKHYDSKDISVPSFQRLNAILKPIDEFSEEQDRLFEEMDLEEQDAAFAQYMNIQGVIGVPRLLIRSTLIIFYYDKMTRKVHQLADPYKIQDYLNALINILDNEGDLHYVEVIVKSGVDPSWLREYNALVREMRQIPSQLIKHQSTTILPHIKQLMVDVKTFLLTPLSKLEQKYDILTPQQIAWFACLIDIFAEKIPPLPLEHYHQKLDYLLEKAIRLEDEELEYHIQAIKEDNLVFGEEMLEPIEEEDYREIETYSRTSQPGQEDIEEPIMLLTIGTKAFPDTQDVIDAFYLSLSEEARLRWEQFCVYCSEMEFWDPPFLFGSIGWEHEARQEDSIGFIRSTNNRHQLFLKAALFRSSSPFNEYLEIEDDLLPNRTEIIAGLVRCLREGKRIGINYDPAGSILKMFFDNSQRSWERQFIWECLFAELVDIEQQGEQWILFLPPDPLLLLSRTARKELLAPSSPRWKDNTLVIGTKIIGVDSVLMAVAFDPTNSDPTLKEAFPLSWLDLQVYLSTTNLKDKSLSLENSFSLKLASDYLAYHLGRFVRLILVQDPQKIVVVLEKSVSLDFGMFQEEADQWYDIPTKKKLGEMTLARIEQVLTQIADPRVELQWVESEGTYNVCSVCGQPFDGSCPHYPRHRIVDLTPECDVIDIAFEVIRKQVEKTIKGSHLRAHEMAEYLISDETGQAILTVWDKDTKAIKVGQAYLLKGGSCKLFKSDLRLVRGKGAFFPLKELPWLPKSYTDSSA